MVERFQMKHEHDWICARQDDKGYWVRHSDHEAELSALKKQVEELTAERDDARRYAVEARLRENQAEDRRVSESFARTKAEAEVAALRKALEEIRKLSGLDDLLIEGASAIVMSRMADIHQHSDAALTSTKETSE